jgi:type 1 glutamine amidotransferase
MESKLLARSLVVTVLTAVITMVGDAQAPQPAGGQGRGAGRAGGAPGVRPPQNQVANVLDVQQMLAALPDTAPATPQRPRKVLVLGSAAGFVHSSIPLAARTIEALGNKTGAWNTVITYNAADINAANLQQYDAIFLSSTTGCFLDQPGDKAATDARRAAFLAFVRGGKGIGGIHAATDSYRGTCPNDPPPAPAPAAAAGAAPAGRGGGGGTPRWPEFNQLIGGFFKFHWSNGTQISVKIEDTSSPLTAMFARVNAQTGEKTFPNYRITDEIYTFNQDSWSRKRTHVLTSIDYNAMPAEVKAQESNPRTDHDYGISYIQREGEGRVFVNVLGHDENTYKQRVMLAHILAGMQYALGDLKADDSPSQK